MSHSKKHLWLVVANQPAVHIACGLAGRDSGRGSRQLKEMDRKWHEPNMWPGQASSFRFLSAGYGCLLLIVYPLSLIPIDHYESSLTTMKHYEYWFTMVIDHY